MGEGRRPTKWEGVVIAPVIQLPSSWSPLRDSGGEVGARRTVVKPRLATLGQYPFLQRWCCRYGPRMSSIALRQGPLSLITPPLSPNVDI